MVHLVTSSGDTQVLLIIYCVVLSVTLSDPCMRCLSRLGLLRFISQGWTLVASVVNEVD